LEPLGASRNSAAAETPPGSLQAKGIFTGAPGRDAWDPGSR